MQVFKYALKLLDPLFYSLEGFSGAYTPPCIHATALNFAALNILNFEPAAQPYIMSDANGGRNIPRYTDSRASPIFYFTAGRLNKKFSIDYMPDLTKGEHDTYLQKTKQGEPLKISRLYYISPETEFEGYLILYHDVDLNVLKLLRLGSFRGKAELTFDKALKIIRVKQDCYVDHLVDPLVCNVKRGVFKNILPYPLIENAMVAKGIIVKEGMREVCIALPEEKISFDENEMSQRLNELDALRLKINSCLNQKDCETLMLLLRTSFSIYYFLSGISSEKFLNEKLREIEEFPELRDAIRLRSYKVSRITFEGIMQIVEGKINECKKKIKGDIKGSVVQGPGDGSSTIIL
jgi:hypothetical protein